MEGEASVFGQDGRAVELFSGLPGAAVLEMAGVGFFVGGGGAQLANRYSKSCEYRVRDRCRAHGLWADRVPLSGACAAVGKGDVVIEGGKYLADHKSTRGRLSTTLKRTDLEKIRKQAAPGVGFLTLSFNGCHTIYAVLDIEDLLPLILKGRNE